MGARTGKQFLAGLRKPREIWVGEDKVDDVVSHPAFAGAAQTLAQIFDLQHEAADVCLMPDPETGEPINVSHMIPRSRADLDRRHACLQTIAEFTVGLMGRTPDYMNVTFAGFAGRADEWAGDGNDRGAANLVAYQKLLARDDVSLTHTIVHPTIDKATGDAPAPGNDVALHKVADTEHGIVVRGARILATLAPFADELAVYPAHPLPEGADGYALSFCDPDGHAGAQVPLPRQLRDPAESLRPPVLEPLRRAGRVRDLRRRGGAARSRCSSTANRDVYNRVMTTGWYPNIMQQTMIRAQTKLEFAYGLGTRMAEAINDTSPATQADARRDLDVRRVRPRGDPQRGGRSRSSTATACGSRTAARSRALRAALPSWFPRVAEILTLIGSHNLLATPTSAQLRRPELARRSSTATCAARTGRPPRNARALFRLAWDFVGSALAGRNVLYERFYLASGARNYAIAHSIADKGRALRLVDGILGDNVAPAESPSSAARSEDRLDPGGQR